MMPTRINLLQALSELPDVLDASERSRRRRNAAAGRLIAAPPPGTPLLVTLSLVLEHTGIYLGDSRVAELCGGGEVRVVSLTRFVNGDAYDALPFRTGTRVFAACDALTRRPLASPLAARTAREAIRRGERLPYDIGIENCHQFTAACVRGVLPSAAAFRHSLGTGLASIDKLERVLADELNGGRKVAWCAVARSRENFHYRLTNEKMARLRLEGVL